MCLVCVESLRSFFLFLLMLPLATRCGMNSLPFLPNSSEKRYGAAYTLSVSTWQCSEHYLFLGSRCGKVKRIHYECARPHELPKVISVPCYGATEFLCDCANFLFSLSHSFSCGKKFMATARATVPSRLFFLFPRARGRSAGRIFAESFLSGL